MTFVMLAPELPKPNIPAVYLDALVPYFNVSLVGVVAHSVHSRTEGSEVLVELCKSGNNRFFFLNRHS